MEDGQPFVLLAALNVNLYGGEGGRLNVFNLTSGIALTLEIGQDESLPAGAIQCGVWDEEMAAWVDDGLTTAPSPEGKL
eukprot:4374640-Amphidinium_carterae.1